jgi:hypothetical protein
MATQLNPTAAVKSFCRRLRGVLAGWAVFAAAVAPALGQFDYTAWTFRVGGQVVSINPDGSFLIPNIAAPDQFGPGGPGTAPDFLSDDFLRAVGVNTTSQPTLYAFSEFFRIRQGQSYTIQNLTITAIPPPSPEFLRASVSPPTITQLGGTAQLTVIATLGDGSTLDVTAAQFWTSYRSSNPSVATVDNDGRVTGVSRGTVYITAVNEGTAAVTQVDVIPGSELTTVVGLVQNLQGSPLAGIDVFLVGAGGSATTGADGHFSIPGVTTELRIAGLIARGKVGDDPVFGRTGPLQLVPSGMTDAGIIAVRPCHEIGLDCTDTDNDCIPDSVETRMRLNPQSPDSDNDGIPDGEEDTDGDSFTNCTESLQGTDPGSADSDRDGVSDRDEILRYGTDPVNPDTDFDGLSDGPELFVHGTDPFNPDTDGDGWDDNGEILEGTRPLVADSAPSFDITSRPVSFLNALPEQLPPNLLFPVVSAAVSYLNALPDPLPQSVFVSVFSPSISYLNCLRSPPSPTAFVVSLIVSYQNNPPPVAAGFRIQP